MFRCVCVVRSLIFVDFVFTTKSHANNKDKCFKSSVCWQLSNMLDQKYNNLIIHIHICMYNIYLSVYWDVYTCFLTIVNGVMRTWLLRVLTVCLVFKRGAIHTRVSMNESDDWVELPNDDSRWPRPSSRAWDTADRQPELMSDGCDRVPTGSSSRNWSVAICWDWYWMSQHIRCPVCSID